MAYTNGQKVSLGTLKVNGTTYAKPSNPWRTDENSGNLINYNGTAISIENTVGGKALDWIYVEDAGKKLLICDRCLVATVTWDNLNSANLIFGKQVTIDGKKYKLRSMTGGVNSSDKNNEWSRIIENNQYGIGNSDSIWHWNKVYTWCQETNSGNSSSRALRGYSSASTWDYSTSNLSTHSYAFRPVLEILNTAPLISDTDQNLGSYSSPFSESYTVSDSENHKMTIKEYLDGVVINTMTNQSNSSHTINLSSRWAGLSNGSHTIKITATDSQGETSTRIWTFTKTNTPPKKPVIKNLTNGMRTKKTFDVIFTPRTDAENNTQTFAVEVADNSSFPLNKQVFSTGLKKKVGNSWVSQSSFTNADEGSDFKLKVTNISDADKKYIRVSTIDVNGSNVKNYSDIVYISPVDILKLETLPYQTDYMPKVVNIKLDSVIDSKASLNIEVCNNANDDVKAWENATQQYLNGEVYEFANTSKTASSYAVSVRITIEANDSTSEISIKSVGLGVM